MRSADKDWASGQIDWEKARERERIHRILLEEKAEKLAAAEADAAQRAPAALEQRVRDLSEPVPPVFRKAFAEEG
jgi:hypothetical protein